jgi:uncharacterized protein (TIGR00369 family)
MTDLVHRQIVDVNHSSQFNRWAGFSVVSAASGLCVLELTWREEFGQHSGFLHAGLTAALLDTSCGFAAASVLGAVTTSQISISYLVPAVGERFRAEATLVRGGKRQTFAEARLIARSGETETLAAKAAAALIRLDATPAVGSSKL